MATATAPAPSLPATTQETGVMEFTPFMSKDSIKLSVSIVQNMVCVPTKSGKVCSSVQAMKFMMLCRARALNPFEGDAYLIGYDTQDGPQFSLITAHQAFLKRAETHPEYDGMESGVIVLDKDGAIVERHGDFRLEADKLVGGWATVFFKERTHPMQKRLRLETFRKPFGVWKSDPEGMIVKCAEADALRSSFPTMLGGMYLEDSLPGVIEAPSFQPTASKSDALASRLANGAGHTAPTATETQPETDAEQTYQHREPEPTGDKPGTPTEAQFAALYKLLLNNLEASDTLGKVEDSRKWAKAQYAKFEEGQLAEIDMECDQARDKIKSGRGGKSQGDLLDK